MLAIHFGHAVDYLQAVLGYEWSKTSSVLVTGRKETVLVGKTGEVIDEHFPVGAPDAVFFQGLLKGDGESVGREVPINMSIRGGQVFKDTDGMEWRIYGEKGEIRVTAAGPFLQVGYEGMSVKVYDFQADQVEEVKWDESPFEGLEMKVRNVAKVYEAIWRVLEEAKGKAVTEEQLKKERLCSFEDAMDRHKLLDGMLKENGF